MLTNPVLISVLVMVVLCLLKFNVLLAIIISALCAGLVAGVPLHEVIGTLIGGMGGQAETALSYILLGAMAVAISRTGIADILVRKVTADENTSKSLFLLVLAGLACFSQNLIPVHIAFIPILIPPLLTIMNRMKIDRRAVACALTFGLKAPYVMLPVGFGMIFHTIVAKAMTESGVPFAAGQVWKATLLPGLGMVAGLLIAIFISYRKDRIYNTPVVKETTDVIPDEKLNIKHIGALAGAVAAFAIQIVFTRSDWSGGLPLGALCAIIVMMLFGSFKIRDLDSIVNDGVGLMGFIAFVMLVAAGYAEVLKSTGGIETLVAATAQTLGGSKLIAAFVMLLIGLIVTMGIGTSFGTVPVVAAIFVPLAAKLGFSPLATACLIAVAGALGDAGSPASDSTLGPTSGLNADGQHDHIWDTCVPTFLHYNIPLLIVGTIAAAYIL